MKQSSNLLGKGRLLLPSALLMATLFSCSKDDIMDPSQEQGEVTGETAVLAETSSANLIFQESFEGSSPLSTLHDQFGTSYAFNVVSSPVFAGSKAGRFELRDSDPITSGGTRSEVLFPEPESLEQWYSFAVYFPAADYEKDSNNDIINQWHQGTSPSLSLRVENDRFSLRVGNTKETRKDIDLGAQTKNVWHTFVYHIKHSSGSDGLVEIWHNGSKILTHTGGNMYDNGKLPRWKLGIYKDDWNYDETTDTDKRVLIFDNIKVGTKSATYAEMNPGSTSSGTTSGGTSSGSTESTAPTAPESSTGTTAPSNGAMIFMLVNSETEKDVMTINNGAVINLSALGIRKANIRAVPASGVNTVKMELSGAQSKTYTDSKAPFALHGDDGAGNFYYGNWNPPALGSYSLKATPYSNGVAGAPVSVSFTFTNSGTTSSGTSSGSTESTAPTAPESSTGTTAPSTSGLSVVSFTLVNSATEKDVMTITNGATISLSALGLEKANIRANTSSAAGSVKMELGGTQSRTYTDNKFPYALHGDNGLGNYYYGNWNPPAVGSYSLKATPYSGSSASGTAGASYSVNFTIVK